uniref:Lrp/AsnC family transcriptional regulator n=1 Tax=Acidocella sp. C78 TaxID=1671486 RepID=UPI00191BC6BB|nr:Lrp/AsnC family transcriptional regulator [Acidocella sp. C78]
MVKSGTIDDFDREILSTLRSDARISMLDLAERVGLSATPVARRVRRLEREGIIRGYTVMIDEAALGYDVSVFVSVKLDKQVDDALVRFEAAIASFPEVVDCWLMTGSRDYLLRVVTTSLAGFEQFLVGQLTRVRGVASIESSIPLRRVKAGVSRAA